MAMLRLVLVVALLLVALLLAVVATRPAAFRVQRSLRIGVPRETLFALVSDFHRFDAWSPWAALDAEMQKRFSGAQRGQGAVYEWRGNAKVGQGRMEIIDAVEPARVVIKLDFLKPFVAHNTVEYILVDHDKPSYKDPPKELAYFAYKRINHFNEWLNQVQGKETTEIPDEVYDNLLLQIKKQKITNMALLTPKRVKDILKKLRGNKYYEHTPHIINRLNGIPSPHLPPELEDRLRSMFCQIQVPFLKHAPPSRKNFLSYSYCIHKLLQLLERDEYLSSFHLLKSREKLQAQDMVWQKICNELGWDFIPSL